MQPAIDIIYHSSNEQAIEWSYGDSKHIQPFTPTAICKAVAETLETTTAEWVVFHDYDFFGNPNIDLILELSQKPVDAFHGGLKAGTRGLPEVMNHVHPTWMYNIDGDDSVTHSNFRLSFQCCMIRTSVFEKLGPPSGEYATTLMCGVAYGYSVLKHGGIIRYHPELIPAATTNAQPTAKQDEWIFARQFFTRKWQLWTMIDKPGFFNNLKQWRATGHVKYIGAKPSLHASQMTGEPVQPATVSVLAPTLDRYPYLEEELRELNEQTILPHEVLVTDQTDKDRRQQIDFSKYPNITVKYFPQDEKGQCVAWNKLIDESTGEYIFFFGDDAYDIKPGLVEKMLQTMYRFDADMVASNVREKGIVYGASNYHYYMSDTFPITLIKKSVVEKAGKMDMFFNRNVKADHDLAMRCHLQGALMIFDPSAEIGHHRAPSGGLRAHNARVITGFMTKNTITKVLNPTSSEIFIYNKYYSTMQFLSHVKIKYMNQVIINGNIIKKILRLFVLLYKIPQMKKGYRSNKKLAFDELDKRGIKHA